MFFFCDRDLTCTACEMTLLYHGRPLVIILNLRAARVALMILHSVNEPQLQPFVRLFLSNLYKQFISVVMKVGEILKVCLARQ